MSWGELVDVVDEQDNPTGQQIDMEDAHKQVLPHRISAVLVFRENGKMLVQVHKYHGRRLDHAVGGHVSAGEDYETAAYREMEEELGISNKLKTIAEGVVSDEYYHQTDHKVFHIFGVYTTTVSDDWQLTETEEVDRLIEMDLEEVVKDMNANPDKYLQGFFTSLGAYLRSISSKLIITAYGKEWGKL